MLAEVAGPDQLAAKKLRPGNCTKKNPSQVSKVDLSRDRYIASPKLAIPAGNTFARGLLFTWDKRDSRLFKGPNNNKHYNDFLHAPDFCNFIFQ